MEDGRMLNQLPDLNDQFYYHFFSTFVLTVLLWKNLELQFLSVKIRI